MDSFRFSGYNQRDRHDSPSLSARLGLRSEQNSLLFNSARKLGEQTRNVPRKRDIRAYAFRPQPRIRPTYFTTVIKLARDLAPKTNHNIQLYGEIRSDAQVIAPKEAYGRLSLRRPSISLFSTFGYCRQTNSDRQMGEKQDICVGRGLSASTCSPHNH